MIHAVRAPRLACVAFAALAALTAACSRDDGSAYAREHYRKREVRVAMRDGTELFTAIYSPKDATKTYPILLCRTPYGIGPYGASEYKATVGPSDFAMRDGFIVAYQDVRGCYLSGGEFENVRPVTPRPTGAEIVDETTDAHDTIAWLLANVTNHNGKVGMWGVSYPGFYAASGMIDHHPALAAVSPQAPIADWFFDDFHRNGAFCLVHALHFFAGFGQPRPEPTTDRRWGFQWPGKDSYELLRDLGPVSNVDARYFHGRIPFWNALVAHPTYDEFWQARDLRPHLKNVPPAVMTVGGWYDAEDLFGALQVYASTEQQNPEVTNVLVMGPWEHGGWAEVDGDQLGDASFGSKTSLHFREKIELAFFDRFLKGKEGEALAEATVFETGANRWRSFDAWPPTGLETRSLYFQEGRRLAFEAPPAGAPSAAEPSDSFVSDPADPVPYTGAKVNALRKEFMTEDQRFASKRPDVVACVSGPLEADVTVAGPIQAELWVSTSGTDSDWIVKLVDVLPEGTERLVRAEAIRGRFRESVSRPKPFVPDEPTLVPLHLQDVCHTFAKGHRIMVQVQCTWFPFLDRNPQTYVESVFEAKASDFTKATQKVFRSPEHPTRLVIGVLPR